MLLFYVRHGEPIYDPDSLTEFGLKQAESLVERLCLYGLDEIYASTSHRAIQTAIPTAKALNKEIIKVDFASEAHSWENLTWLNSKGRIWLYQALEIKELFHTSEIKELGFEWYNHPCFKGYKYKEEMKRIEEESNKFFLSLGYRHLGNGKYIVENDNNKKIALFAHQGFGLAFLSILLNIPYPQFSTHFDMCHTGVTVIEFKNENGYAYPKVLTLSNDSHLLKKEILKKYNNEVEF